MLKAGVWGGVRCGGRGGGGALSTVVRRDPSETVI